MRTKLASVILLTTTLGFGAAAFAATPIDATGSIKAIDAKAMTVTLNDGTIYVLPKGFKLAAFKVGEKVKVQYELKDTVRDLTTMKPAA